MSYPVSQRYHYLILFLLFGFSTEITYLVGNTKRSVKRFAEIGTILTWNINEAHYKFDKDEGDPIKSVTCRVLHLSVVAALQQADNFDPYKHCGASAFKSASNGDLITLVKTDADSPFLTVKKIKNVLVTLIKCPDINSGKAFIVVNVHLGGGKVNTKNRRERLQHLNKNILPTVVSEYLQTQKGQSPLIILMGDFNLDTESKEEMELITDIKINGDALVPILQYSNTDPFTTPTGKRYDNILISGDNARKGDIEVNLPIFTSPIELPDARLLGLVNNFMVVQYGMDSRTQESTLKKLQTCITSYLDSGKFESYDCDARWTSSVSISNHLPLQLLIKVNNKKEFAIGTWNIGRAHQRLKFSSDDTEKLIESTLKKFDIMVLQEISTVEEQDMAKLLRRYGILRLVVDSSVLEYGVYVNFDKIMVDTKDIIVRTVPFMSEKQKPAARIALSVKFGGNTIKLCLYNVHLSTGSSEKDVRDAVDQLKGDEYEACDLALAMGDFSTGNTDNPDIGSWSDLPIVPVQCYHMENDVAQTDTFTKMTTRDRTDYIFVLSYKNAVSGIGKCELWHTGDDPKGTKVEDWTEVSDHYPLSMSI